MAIEPVITAKVAIAILAVIVATVFVVIAVLLIGRELMIEWKGWRARKQSLARALSNDTAKWNHEALESARRTAAELYRPRVPRSPK